MMESRAEFQFEIEGKQTEWSALIEGLAQNKHGAYFEEYAEAFGRAAEDAAEAVLDAWEVGERGEIDSSGSSINGNRGQIVLFGFRALEASVGVFKEFLEACGAKNLKVISDLDSWRS